MVLKRTFRHLLSVLVVPIAFSPCLVQSQTVTASKVEITDPTPVSGDNLVSLLTMQNDGGIELKFIDTRYSDTWDVQALNSRFEIQIKNGSDIPHSVLRLRDDTQDNTFWTTSKGVGIGFGPPGSPNSGSSGDPNGINHPLDIVGGPNRVFPNPTVRLLMDTPSNTNTVKFLHLENSGGGTNVSMIDGSSNTFFDLENSGRAFKIINTGSAANFATLTPFTIADGTENNTLSLSPNGVCVGRAVAGSRLESYANGAALTGGGTLDSSTISSLVEAPAIARDRTMLNLENRGGAFMTFTDTSRNSTWFFSNSNDELFMKKSGAGSPGLRILSSGEFRFVNANQSQFAILANGNITARGVLLHSSDRNLKENIQNVDPQEVLGKLVDLPISTWNYIHDEDNTPHMGPMAQDFYATFGLGVDDKTIAEIDKSGIAIAAIQGLNAKVDAKDQKINELTDVVASQASTIEDQADMIAELTARMERLEALVAPQK